MSEATSLYRRHRPGSFDQVVGQCHVVRTLSNAIERDQIHHAYLFVGSRGTGKTSMAKILAASLNCEKGGPTLTPCGVCESCRSIAAGTSVDVIEMDAASNRSVDDIRGLRDRVAFAPTQGSWKVYILDEAHMLTKEAWNAFLKTLEEPPPNTVFILATTEAHKVMPTIADRCQRFDFQRPSMEQLSEVLNRVSVAETIEIEAPAVSMIARSASGSFRDALGTLDQLVAYSGKKIELNDVIELLGAADADLLFGVVDAIVASDPKAVLAQVETMAQSGRDPARFARDMLGHLRVLLVTQTTGEIPEALAVTASDAPRLAAQANAIGPATLIRTIDELAAALTTIREGDEARLAVEVALLKAARPDLDPGAEGLMRRIEKLERSGVPAAAPPVMAPAPAPPAAPEAPGPSVSVDPGPESDDPGPSAQYETVGEAAAPGPPTPVASAPPSAAPEPIAVAESAPSADDLDLEKVTQVWPTVIEALRASGSGPTASYFEGTRPTGAGGGKVEIGFPPESSFNRRNAEKPERRQQLTAALLTVTGERTGRHLR
ncbi:MAG: DNA polymerase III subunit gamma/tau [Solirubrobacterales bacterium]|nr:DNA polymerase III subunit gamma/tau [Solirubrobacterales bacterium]